MRTTEQQLVLVNVSTKWWTIVRPYVAIARPDHWVKNVFVLPGIVVALSFDRSILATPWVVSLLAVSLVASSNYVLNEILDAPFDVRHPIKCLRPIPSGQVSIPIAYIEWIVLMLAGIALGLTISHWFTFTLAALWIMGCVYNVPPLRTKDVPYLDVLTEAINNPLRMLAGWFLTRTAAVPPLSLLISYWMVGCYFMAIKRFAELQDINDRDRSAAYRKSFAFYTPERLLTSVIFYGCCAMLFFGTFLMRYRLELVLSFPMIAIVMAVYLSMAFKRDGAAQNPEKLYKEPLLMASVMACTVVMTVLLFVDVPLLYRAFTPTLMHH